MMTRGGGGVQNAENLMTSYMSVNNPILSSLSLVAITNKSIIYEFKKLITHAADKQFSHQPLNLRCIVLL